MVEFGAKPRKRGLFIEWQNNYPYMIIGSGLVVRARMTRENRSLEIVSKSLVHIRELDRCLIKIFL